MSSSSSSNTTSNTGGSTFDPTSSANVAASISAIIALFCLCIAAFNLGKERYRRNTSTYQLSWWAIPTGLCLFISALCIFFMYD